MTNFALPGDWPEELDDAELGELDQYLRAHADGEEDRLMLDGVHGLLTAVGIGPDRVLPEEWLPEILHDPFADEDEGRRVLELLARLCESVEYEVENDDYEPILGEIELDEGDVALSAFGWCEGFSRGIDLRARLWESRLGVDSRLTELLGPIMALAIEEGVFATDVEIESLSGEEYGECLAQLSNSVVAVARYWAEAPPAPEELGSTVQAGGDDPGRKRRGRWLH